MSAVPLIRLADTVAIPNVGLGTYPMDDAEAETGVSGALDVGYRLVDTAASYENEVGVGRGIARSDVPRGDVFVTTKLRGRDQGYQEALHAFEESLDRLGLDYLDLYLIHWPLPRVDKYVESWRAMIKLRDDGVVRSIGVSNFTGGQLDRLLDETGVMPVINQIEMHPRFTQQGMRGADAERGVRTESWSPLGRSSALLKDSTVTTPAEKYGVSPGQVVLRWHIQLGVIPIPKSSDPRRQRENLALFDFELDSDEMAAISSMPQHRTGGDPETHEEF
jgi:diketogulonate reductase-like aldo/keto reductase